VWLTNEGHSSNKSFVDGMRVSSVNECGAVRSSAEREWKVTRSVHRLIQERAERE